MQDDGRFNTSSYDSDLNPVHFIRGLGASVKIPRSIHGQAKRAGLYLGDTDKTVSRKLSPLTIAGFFISAGVI
jgi:hypothetical protein